MSSKRVSILLHAAALCIGAAAGLALSFAQTPVSPQPTPRNLQRPPGIQLNVPVSGATLAFVNRAMRDGMAEVRLAQLALSRSMTLGVRNFAQRMVADHGTANKELAQLAQRHRIVIPLSLTPEQETEINALRSLKGMEFDVAYASRSTREHNKLIALYSQASHATNVHRDFSVFARKVLSTLHNHHLAARQLAARAEQSAADAAQAASVQPAANAAVRPPARAGSSK